MSLVIIKIKIRLTKIETARYNYADIKARILSTDVGNNASQALSETSQTRKQYYYYKNAVKSVKKCNEGNIC